MNLLFEASGKTWAVLIDDDISGDNGYVKIGMDICGTGTNIQYSPSLQPTGKITLEAIVKFTTFNQNQGILSTNEYGGYGLWVYETKPNEFIQINSVYHTAVVSSNELNLNRLYHVAGVYDGSELKFYIDKNLKETISTTGLITYIYQNALKIGSDASSTDAADLEFFYGTIDEIRITNIALKPEQFLPFKKKSFFYGRPI